MGNYSKIKIAFSGGGFRATFFCLGAYRRLVELGIESIVSHITSVSGGSIAAGAIMYALSNGEFTSIKDFDRRVTEPLIKLGQLGLRSQITKTIFDIRTLHKLPRTRFSYHFPILLDKELFHGKLMEDLPTVPEWTCNATCLNTTKRFRFKVNEMYGHRIGTTTDVSDIKVSFAVAASAAFPILLAPIRLDISNKTFEDRTGWTEPNERIKPNYVFLTDGGVYDNLGSENLLKGDTDSPIIILDASAKIPSWPSNYHPSYFSLWWRTLEVSMDQIVQLRRRLIFHHPTPGIQLSIERPIEKIMKSVMYHNSVNTTPLPDYATRSPEIEKLIGGLRTDLDAFHDIEIETLIWAGAVRMDLAIKSWLPHLIASDRWLDTPAFPNYPTELIKRVLSHGQKRKKFGKLHKKLKA